MNFYIHNLISFIIGTTFGSFLSVLIQRSLKKQRGIFFGKSMCPKCLHKLTFSDMIPVLSWILKLGKCSYCKKSISIIYPCLELLSGLLFMTNFNMITNSNYFDFYNNGSQFDIMFWIKIFCLNAIVLSTLTIFFSDMQKKAIPNIFLYAMIILAIPTFLLSKEPILESITSRLIALGIALGFFGGQYMISKGKWLGSGDIFVGVGMALLLGWQKLLLALILSYIGGSILVIAIILANQMKAKKSVPFAPFLILGTLIALYEGNQIIEWYINTPIF